MHEFTNSPLFYDVPATLSRSKDPFSKDPFSHSFYRLPFKEMIDATKMLWNHLVANLRQNGFTEEELRAVAALQRKLEEKQKEDIEWRMKRDTVLRCMHPDGCYFPFLDKDVVRSVYASCDVDPIQGVQGLPLRDPEKVCALAERLEKEIRKLEIKRMR